MISKVSASENKLETPSENNYSSIKASVKEGGKEPDKREVVESKAPVLDQNSASSEEDKFANMHFIGDLHRGGSSQNSSLPAHHNVSQDIKDHLGKDDDSDGLEDNY